MLICLSKNLLRSEDFEALRSVVPAFPVNSLPTTQDAPFVTLQEIRFVQLELEELVMQAELESLCSAVECMIQNDNQVMQELSKGHSYS